MRGIKAISCRYPPGVSLLLATIYGFERFRTKRCRQFVNYTNCSAPFGSPISKATHNKRVRSVVLREERPSCQYRSLFPSSYSSYHLHAAAQHSRDSEPRIQIQLPKCNCLPIQLVRIHEWQLDPSRVLAFWLTGSLRFGIRLSAFGLWLLAVPTTQQQHHAGKQEEQ